MAFSLHDEESRVALRHLIDGLVAAGVEDLVKLPNIAVMGDTSSGKSSVLSALSGVEFPSSADICTRCPIRVRLEKRDKELFSVNAKREDGNTFAKSCNTAREVTVAIGEAQRFVCNGCPTVVHDVVEVNVAGPNQTDLTVVDLPGIVRTVSSEEDANLPERVNTLLEKYLKNDRCVILAVQPANIDYHNNEILAKAKKVDPELHRTVPVLTKADRIEDGADASVRDLIEGKTFDRGFHIVKCRSQNEVDSGVTLSAAIENEARFFQDTEWTKSIDKQSLGIPALRAKLSEIYFEIVRKNVEGIKEDILRKRSDVKRRFESLGSSLETAGERRAVYEKAVYNLISYLSGNSTWTTIDGNHFTHRALMEAEKEKFAAALLTTNFYLFDRLQPAVDGSETLLPANGNREPDHIPYLANKLRSCRGKGLVVFEGRTVFDAEVQNRVKTEWEPLATQFANNLVDICKQLLYAATETTLAPLPFDVKALRAVILSDFDAAIADAADMAAKIVQQHIQVECSPSTENHYLTETIQKKRTEKMFEELLASADRSGNVTAVAIKTMMDKTSKLPLISAVAQEISIVLSSYAKVAGKRLGDTLSGALEELVVEPLLRHKAPSGLRSRTDEDIVELFPSVEKHAALRQSVLSHLNSLEEALRVVDHFVSHHRRAGGRPSDTATATPGRKRMREE